MLLYSISKWFCKNQSGRAFFFFGLTHERLLNERTKAFFIPHVMLFVAPDGKFKSRYKISGAMKHNVWCYEQVCVAPAANLLIARVSSWRDYLAEKFI
jgi:hypothetical protein